jgi:hypothetical protein
MDTTEYAIQVNKNTRAGDIIRQGLAPARIKKNKKTFQKRLTNKQKYDII